MRYTHFLQQVLSVSLLLCLVPIALVEASFIHGPSHAHVSRHAGLAALAKRAEGDVQLFNRGAGSRWTFYDAQTGNAGSCGQFLSNTGFTVAMNAAQMNPGLCFKTIRMTFGGKSTTATIVDTCPGCPFNGLDLTQSLFGFFLGHIPSFSEGGVLTGEWELGSADAPPAPPVHHTTPPPPPPKKTFTPAPTTTKKPAVTSSVKKSSTTTHASSSKAVSSTSASASSIDYSSGPASALAVPTGTVDTGANGNEPNNLLMLNQVFIGMSGLVMAAGNL